MKRICAWCKKALGVVPSEAHGDVAVTHGICKTCSHELLAEAGVNLTTFLDGLDAPVVVLGEDGVVKTANKQARVLLRKKPWNIEDRGMGDVFECAHASLPGGCGQTIHCLGCTIRILVESTHETSRSQLRTPAYLHIGTPESHKKTRFLVSTEKVAGVVLLRIDDVCDGE